MIVVDDMIKDIKRVRSMPQIKIDGELVGGYNQLIEHYNKEGKVDFKAFNHTQWIKIKISLKMLSCFQRIR